MDIEKLIRRLRNDADAYRNGKTLGRAFADQEDVLDNAATAISTLQAENEKLRAELEQVKRELSAYKELGPIDRLRELKQADDEGRCVVLPFKPPRWVYMCSARFPKPAKAHYASAINVLQDMDNGCVFGDTQKEAEAALRREQDG